MAAVIGTSKAHCPATTSAGRGSRDKTSDTAADPPAFPERVVELGRCAVYEAAVNAGSRLRSGVTVR
jgi:hypothetical protein